MQRTLVTGASGLIGRHTVARLVMDGHEVVAYDRDITQGSRLLPPQVGESVTWREGDTRDVDRLTEAMRGVDKVIHLAAGASFLMYEEDPVEQTAGTVQGFHTLLETARHTGVDTVVHASTSAVYEGNPTPYREGMALRPPDLKAFAKKVNEEVGAMYGERYGIRCVGLRPFSVYGEDEMPKGRYANVVSLFAWALLTGTQPVVWGDGTQSRDFVHVDDVARAFVLALHPSVPAGVFNVCTGVETSFNSVIELLCRRLGLTPDPVHTPVPVDIYAQRLLGDGDLSAEVLGFRPKITLEEGVDRVLVRAREALQSGDWPNLGQAQTRSVLH